LTKCQLHGCDAEAAFYCFYAKRSGGKARIYHTYRFCAFHAKEIQGGEWEGIK